MQAERVGSLLKCPELACLYIAGRSAHLRSHGCRKHGLNGDKLSAYMLEAVMLSRAGPRVTTEERIRGLLGPNKHSVSHYESAVRVLEGHMVKLPTGSASQPGPGSKPKEHACKISRPERRVTHARLAANGLQVLASRGSMCTLAHRFVAIQRERVLKIGEAQIFNNARLLDRFVKFGLSRHATWTETQVILSDQLPGQFVGALGKAVEPFSMRNHLTAIGCFIEACLGNPALADLFPPKTCKHQLKRVLPLWSKFKKDADALARRGQRAKIMKGELQPFPLLGVLRVLSEERQGVAGCLTLLEKSKFPAGSSLPADLNGPYSAVTATLATLLLLQGCRLGTMNNLTVEEVLSSVDFQMHTVFRVAAHKTSALTGPAPFALGRAHGELLRRFAAFKRAKALPGNVLASPTGSALQASVLFKRVDTLLGIKYGSAFNISPNNFRKFMESHAFPKHCAATDRTNSLSVYFGHESKRVVDSHYAYKTDDWVVCQCVRVCHAIAQQASLEVCLQEEGFLPDTPLGRFPEKTALENNLRAQWVSPDVALVTLDGSTYESIKSAWVQKHLVAAAQYIVKELAGVNDSQSVAQAVKRLPPVWHGERSLISYVMQSLNK